METSAFQKGAVFELGRKQYTLLRQVEESTWQAEESRTGRIKEYTQDELHRLYQKRHLMFISDQQRPKDAGGTFLEYTDEQWEAAKLRRAYATAVLDLPSTRAALIPVIEELWRKLQRPVSGPPNVATVMKWKSRFLRADRRITALMDRHDKKGNKMSRFDNDTVQLVQQAIEKKYLTRERGTMQDVVDEAIVLVKRENNLRVPEMQLKRPTARLVRRLIGEIRAFDRYVSRYGRDAAMNRFRAALHARITDAPLARVEIDHTLLDMMVIDEKSNLPLGRPHLTICIDDYTRCILGLHISFEPPSYLTVARCLKHAILPKSGLIEQYPKINNEWLAHGVMRELVVDNGLEFHSQSLEKACLSLGIEIHYAPRKKAWFKGKIERFFGTLNRATAHKAPGTTFRNIVDKGDYDPLKHAVVRYRVLREIIHKWICDVYHDKPHRGLGRITPSAMWAKSVSTEDITVPNDPDLLAAILGRSDRRKLTHKGIQASWLFYNSAELQEVRQKFGDKIEVDIRIDDEDLGAVFVISPDNKELLKVPAVDETYAAGLSLWQHRVIRRFAARNAMSDDNDAWLEAKAEIAEMIEAEFGRAKIASRRKIARFVGDAKLLNDEEPDRAPATRSKQPQQPSQNSVIDVKARPPVIAPEEVSVTEPDSSRQVPGVRIPSRPKRVFKPRYRERNPESLDVDGEVE